MERVAKIVGRSVFGALVSLIVVVVDTELHVVVDLVGDLRVFLHVLGKQVARNNGGGVAHFVNSSESEPDRRILDSLSLRLVSITVNEFVAVRKLFRFLNRATGGNPFVHGIGSDPANDFIESLVNSLNIELLDITTFFLYASSDVSITLNGKVDVSTDLIFG